MSQAEPTIAELIDEYSLRYVDRKEAARILGMSTRKLDMLDADHGHDRTFPASKRLGGRRKWLLRALVEWAENQ